MSMKIRQSIKNAAPLLIKSAEFLNSKGAAFTTVIPVTASPRRFPDTKSKINSMGNSSKNIFRSVREATSAFAPFLKTTLIPRSFLPRL